jgi:hypothetical protein
VIPQSLNTYSYSVDNPITKKDPTGRAFGLDDFAGLAFGGIVGFDIYTIKSAVTNKLMTASDAAQAVFAGSSFGEGIVNAPETGGTSIAIAIAAIRAGARAGASAALRGEIAKQTVNAVQGNQTGIDWAAIQYGLIQGYVTGGVLAGVPDACVSGFPCGAGNMYSTGKSVATRVANGSIRNVSGLTNLKTAVGSQAASTYRTVAGTFIDSAISNSSQSQSSQPFGAPSVSTWMGSFNPFQPHR